MSKKKKKGHSPTPKANGPKKSVVYHHPFYQDRVQRSRAKLQIGTLLLALQFPLSQEQQKKGWQLFEVVMKQYVDLKMCVWRI